MDNLDLMKTWNTYRQGTMGFQKPRESSSCSCTTGVNLDQCFIDGTCNEDPLNVLGCHSLSSSVLPPTDKQVTFCTVKGWEENQKLHH